LNQQMADAFHDMPRGPRAEIPAAETPRTESLLALATGVVIIAALILAREVLIPITLAVFLCFFLAPVVRRLQRLYLPRPAAVAVAVLLSLCVIGGLGMIIGSQIGSLAANLPQYQSTVTQKFETVRSTVNDLTDSITERFHLGIGPLGIGSGASSHNAASRAPLEEKPVPVVVESSSFGSLKDVQGYITPVLSPLGTLAIVIIVTIFFLMQKEDLRDRVIRLAGSKDLPRTTKAIDDAANRLTRYFLTQATINGSFGLLVGLGLFVIGVPSPLLWGVVAGLLRFVPYIGSIVSAVLPMAVAAAVSPGWSMAAWTAALFIVAEGITGQVLEPTLYGSSAGLSPTAIVVVAIFWSWVWGPIGLILSTPLTLCLVVLGRHVRHLEFFDVLFGDRPALTPVETFYQRLLAGDPAEVFEQGASLLKSRALSAYYDDVAMKAMRLLAADVYRGALRPQQLVGMRENLAELVDEFDSFEDVDPELTEKQLKAATIEVSGVARADRETSPPRLEQEVMPTDAEAMEEWHGKRAILCIPGEGPLDEAAAAMLAQLLRKHGLGAEALLHHQVSRTALPDLDPDGVLLVCVVYLDLRGSQPRMRYLLRRVRQRFAGRLVLVGFWAADDAFVEDASAQAMTGMDRVAVSLRDAVAQCVMLARQPASAASTGSGGRVVLR
jgi:predicted PurR-regulated permease PerM